MQDPSQSRARRRWMTHAGLGLLGALGGVPLWAQGTAGKTPRVVLPYPAGSGPDAFVRQLSEKLAPAFGQAALVDNKPGANGFLAIAEAKRAAADGLTWVAMDSTHTALYPLLFKQLPFDLARDFDPVVPLYQTWFYVIVGADSPHRTLAELLAAAKAREGQISFASTGIGSVPHVGTAMLEAATGARMTHVPYKDFQQMFGDVASGRVDWAFGTAATSAPLLRAKKLRYLAIAAPQRTPEFADVPTLAEAAGLPGFELKTWVALFAPKGSPKAMLDRTAAEVNKVFADADFRSRWAAMGIHTWPGADADVARAIVAETTRFANVVKQARIELD